MMRTVITPDRPRIAEGRLTGCGAIDLFAVALGNHELLRSLARRDIESRYRGSALGLLWIVAVPLVMLCAYTFVFAYVFKSKWAGGPGGVAGAALPIYAGMVLFGLFSEPVGRSATLITDNPSYVKKIVFPLRLMPWVVVLTSCFSTLVSTVLLIAFRTAALGVPPWQILALPAAIAPVLLLALGTSWILAALGAYVRDIRHLTGIFTSLLMFVSPVFYPASGVPGRLHIIVGLNPMTPALETMRGLLLDGRVPDALPWFAYLAACWAYAWLGYATFSRLQRGFADVV